MTLTPHPSFPPWVIAARELPVAFAQVREDPRLDAELLNSLPPGADVVMIASGGCTAAALAHGRHAGSLTVVDANPAQLALTRLKHRLLAVEPSRRRRVCGHDLSSDVSRLEEVDAWCRAHEVDPDGICPDRERRARGLDFTGRYECLFERLTEAVQESGLDLDAPRSLQEGAGLAVLRACFREVMTLEVLVALFGPEACANRVQDFADHFLERAVQALRDGRGREGPFLDAMLRTNRVTLDRDWVSLTPRSDATPLTDVEDDMASHLREREPRSADLLHLSNICDWLAPDDASELLRQAGRVLRPGGIVVLRQLNSSLDVPGLDSPITWDEEVSRRATEADRSFFYRNVWIGRT